MLARLTRFLLNCNIPDGKGESYVFLGPELLVHIQALDAALDKYQTPKAGGPQIEAYDVGEDEDGEVGDDIDVDDPQFEHVSEEDGSKYIPPGTTGGRSADRETVGSNSPGVQVPPPTNRYRRPWASDPEEAHARDAYHVPLPSNTIMHGLIHAVLFAAFAQPVNTYVPGGKHHPISLFLALIGITPFGTFKPIDHISPLMARLLYGARITVSNQILIDHADEHGLTTSAPVMTTAEKYIHLLREHSEGTAFREIVHAMTWSRRVARATLTIPRFMPCSEDGMVFEFDGRKHHFRDLVAMCQGTLGTLERRILQLFHRAGVPGNELPSPESLVKIKDNINNKVPGYCVFRDPKLPLHRFHDVFAKNLGLKEEFISVVEGEEHYVTDKWMELSKMIREIMELFFMCCHLMGGAVSRGTSICADSYANPPRGSRNLAYSNSVALIISTYSKLSEGRSYDQVIVRAHCARLSYVILLVLTTIRPLDLFITRNFIAHRYKHNEERLIHLADTYMHFTGGIIFTTTDLTRILRRKTEEYMGYRYSTSDIRQMWCYAKDKFVCAPRHMRHITKHIVLQAGHGPQEEMHSYGVIALCGALRNGDIELYKRISEEYHRCLGISGLEVIDVISTCNSQNLFGDGH